MRHPKGKDRYMAALWPTNERGIPFPGAEPPDNPVAVLRAGHVYQVEKLELTGWHHPENERVAKSLSRSRCSSASRW